MWCYHPATGKGESDWTPFWWQLRRKGVHKLTTRSVPEDLSRTDFSDQVRAEVGRESLLSNYISHIRRASLCIQPYTSGNTLPHSIQRHTSDSGQDSQNSAQDCDQTSLPSSLPSSHPGCMFPSLTELVSTHLLFNGFKVKKLRHESILPSRGIPASAGYDLYAAVDFFIPSKGQVRAPTG